MGLTSYPQPVQKSTQAYINAGTTYTGQYSVNSSPVGSSITLSNPASGYGYYSIPTSITTTLSWGTQLNQTYGSTWYAEIYVPTLTVSTTVATSVTATVNATVNSGATTFTVANATGIASGLVVTGPGIANATTVSSVVGTTVTINNATTVTLFPGAQLNFTPSGTTWPIGTTALPLTSTSNIVTAATYGTQPTCTGLATNSYVTSTGNNAVALSAATTGTVTIGATFTATPSITWTGVLWHNNVVPTQALGARSLYEFFSPDNGTTIYGRQIMANLAGAGL
jgi:hypothetical protein